MCSSDLLSLEIGPGKQDDLLFLYIQPLLDRGLLFRSNRSEPLEVRSVVDDLYLPVINAVVLHDVFLHHHGIGNYLSGVHETLVLEKEKETVVRIQPETYSFQAGFEYPALIEPLPVTTVPGPVNVLKVCALKTQDAVSRILLELPHAI